MLLDIAIYYKYSNTGMKTETLGLGQNKWMWWNCQWKGLACNTGGGKERFSAPGIHFLGKKILKTVVRSMGKRSTTHRAYTWGRKQKKKKKNICVAKKCRQLTEKKQE